ncbi:hypothetical protein MNBD_GAMMA02-1854 [hydrothermal vent metagenome]|uniref:Uncharacterized protein n=1 Tax=hydrothermal vent metagenome TaxID=652676 RepID=A0A3B0WI47_9ZZZZ
MIILLQLLVLLVFLSWVAAWIKPVWLRLLFIIAAAFVIGLEVSSVYLTGQLVDDRFLKHTSINHLLEFGFQFKTEMMMFVGGWIALLLSMYLLARLIHKLRINRYIQVLTLGCLLLLMALPNGILPPLWQSLQIAQADSEDLNQALADLGIEPKSYIKPHQVKATAGKNIIVISLESIEYGFLQEPLNQLTPNLTALSKQWTYFNNMPPITGSDWTAGSLYTHQTGLPALFNQQHFNNNNLFQNSQDFQLTSLNHVLKTAGYQTKYLIGKPEFAGILSILNTLGIEVVSEQNSLGRYPKSQPGLHDKDLFNEAKLQIAAMQENDEKPFALFMSTINTHFPNGIMDERMRGLVAKNDNPLKFLVSATDYLLHDFIQYLAQQKLLDNTVVYIFPDHTLMGNTGEINQTLKQQPRRLYLLSSADKTAFSRQTEEAIFQIDLPQLILEGAEVVTNAKFLTDFITNRQTPDFIQQNSLKIAAVNNAALSRKQFNQGLAVTFSDQQLNIKSQDQSLSTPIRFFNPTEVYQVVFNANMVPLQHQQITLNEAFVNDHIDPRLKLMYLHTYLQNDGISKSTLSNRHGIELTKTGDSIQFTTAEITDLVQQVEIQHAKLKQHKTVPLRQFSTDQQRFIAHAGGAIDGYKYTNSLEALKHNYQQGFRLFELDIQQTADGHFVAVHDWPQWQKQTKFQGELPPTHEIFMQLPILQTYTALDVPAINAWFAQHEDAILVTDKVNLPAEFAAQFTDNSRLMMELFTWNAVKAANKLSLLAVIPTGDLLYKIPGNKLTYLQSLGIKYLATSRRWADSNPNLLRQLNLADIKIFAFHIGFDEGKDEQYVACHERSYFYGLYADQWNFKAPKDCQK